jgi:hypothetical protein
MRLPEGTRAPVAAPAPPPDASLYETVPAEDPRLKQHRCFPRISDFAATVMDWDGFGEKAARFSVMMQCLRSEEGQEPADPPPRHAPDFYALKVRKYAPAGGAAAVAGAAGPAAAAAAAAAAGGGGGGGGKR